MRRQQVAVAPYRPLPGGVAPDGMAEVLGFDEFRAVLDTEEAETLLEGAAVLRTDPAGVRALLLEISDRRAGQTRPDGAAQ